MTFILVLCILIELVCLYQAVETKHRNYGFIATILLVILGQIICICLQRKNAEPNNLLVAYYILYAGMYFSVLCMASNMGKHKNYRLFVFPLFWMMIYQIVIMASDLFGNPVITPGQVNVIGKVYWVVHSGSSISPFLSFNAYGLMSLLSALAVIANMAYHCKETAKIYKSRMLSMLLAQIFFFLIEMVVTAYKMPIWIPCICMMPIVVLGLYYSKYFAARKLRHFSLLEFANGMSDVIFVYDENDDLIYKNNPVWELFSTAVLESFQDKKELMEWASQIETVQGMQVRPWKRGDHDAYFKVQIRDLENKGVPLGTIVMLHDSTDSVNRLFAVEQANANLEQAARMKSDFLANMSHEIRTPMNAVIGMAEIALRESKDPVVTDYLNQIKSSGKNLLNIINDILDFSKIESGKMEILPDRYEPLSEFNDIANTLVNRIGDKDLELFVDASTKIPHALEGDAMRIRQIIINLANNAIKFTKTGSVTIQVDCKQDQTGKLFLVVHVIDTGSGISKENLSKLFVSFQQVDSKRNRNIEGTGLGLAISKRLCEAMGGTIGVHSEYGKGSDFYFSIPQKVLDEETELKVSEQENKRAVYVGSDPRTMGFFQNVLKQLDTECTVYENLDDYVPSDKKATVFIEQETQDDAFMAAHPETVFVVLTGYASMYKSELPNVKVMRRPITTLGITMAMNNEDLWLHSVNETNYDQDYNFTAPEARILVVDDNEINLTVAKGLLQPLEMQIFFAGSGQEAIDLVKKENFDIIFMDHMMPGMDGVEATGIIRREVPAAEKTPIIALTANAMSGAKEMFLSHGMNDFVSKPIELKSIVAKVKQWLPEEKILKGAGSTLQAAPEISYPGLDAGEALKKLGTAALYESVVQEYHRSGRKKAGEIRAAYESGDWKDYTIKVHALKSSSRQVGAMELGDLAAELEEAGNAGNTGLIREKTGTALHMYEEIIQGLDPYFSEKKDQADLPKIDEETLKQQMEALLEASDNLDMDGMNAVKETLQKYSFEEEQKSRMDRLYEAIDDLDPDACTEIAQSILGDKE